MKQRLVLTWVDNTGVVLTGQYRDRLRQHPETKSVPEAKAAMFGDDTPEMRQRIAKHIEDEARNYPWMGFFALPDTRDVLTVAKRMALESAASVGQSPKA